MLSSGRAVRLGDQEVERLGGQEKMAEKLIISPVHLLSVFHWLKPDSS
jgi:hypothetical protein